jgi:hypothetical protein
MAYMPTTNETGTGIRRELFGGEEVFIAQGILISSSDNVAISGASGYYSINIQGTVSAAQAAIRLGDDGQSDSSSSLLVGRNGYVAALGQDFAVEVANANARVAVQGGVWGAARAISMDGEGAGKSVLVNSGSIRADWTVVAHSGNEDFILRNSGEIVGGYDASAFTSADASRDTVINTGIMIGYVSLGSGDDIFDSRAGALDGIIYAGEGDDQLLFGSGDNRLSGGFGNDRLQGGGGRDAFIFDDLLNEDANVDRIVDFNVRDDIFELGNLAFPGLGPGALDKANFTAGKSGKALDEDDRIIYDRDSGRLFYDADGKSGVDAVHFATIGRNMSLGHRDFLVFNQSPSFAADSWDT